MDEQSLVTLLASTEGLKSVFELTGEDAAFLVNILDRALASTSINSHQRKRCTVALTKLCGTLSILPASHLLSGDLKIIGDRPRVAGGLADVWEGRYNGQTVAIKVLRVYGKTDIERVEKRFRKEALIWKSLSHPNILPFVGVANSPFQFGMVSLWMSNGNMVEYLKLHLKDYSIIGPLLSGIAEGLKYLHDNGLVHGDLKGTNILITDNHQVCLAGFGLMTIISDSLSTYDTSTVETGGTTRWMAPELLNPEGFGFDHCSPSRQSDVYAFGMVIYELLTGNIPFIKSGNLVVMLKVVRGDRPEWPNDDVPFFGYTDIVWRLAEECWDQDRNKRPSIHEVLDRLNTANMHIDVAGPWGRMNDQSLVNLLLHPEGLKSVLEVTGEDAAFVVNILDRALASTSINPNQRKWCKVALRKLCATLSILPPSHLLSEGLEIIGDSPLASGGFADVWEGRYNGQKVAIKALKTTTINDSAINQNFYKEVLFWKHLSHPNILPFLGVATSRFQFGMVSPWMTHGNIVEYLKLHPKDRSIIGPLLSGIAKGLKYLHENGLVHGNLKGSNIMIRDDHQACLADFGLMRIVSDFFSSDAIITTQTGGPIMWMAPELLNPEDFGFDHCSPSRQSDVYAFGMVIYEVLTRNVPFGKLGNFAVMQEVANGERPKRPNDDVPLFGFAGIVWRLAEECWNQDRNKRPSIHEVLDRLNTANMHINGGSVSVRWRNMDEQSLATLLLSPEGLHSVLQLAGGDAAFVVNILDRVNFVPLSITVIPDRCKTALRQLCGTLSILPVSHLLSEGLEKIGDSALESGHFADVWEGRYNGQRVAIKVLKTFMTDDIKKVERRFYKEVLIWKQLSHPNILPFFGVATSPFQFGMVSPWMSNGNLVQYLKLHPKKDCPAIRDLVSGVAEGLKYLHENDLVHGDLKGYNILIRDDHQPCLADFGLMTIISDSLSTYGTGTVQARGTIRWMAPELSNPEEFGLNHSRPSRQSDVYAFGMAIYEVLTGNIPFFKSGNYAVVLKVAKGERPERPNDDIPIFGFADVVWKLAEECWDQDRSKRPSIHEVLDRLKSALPNVSPLHSAQTTENPEPRLD